jgi:glyoxylase-like metal-dependent hydrolase (beta-lactamase superfamily II)
VAPPVLSVQLNQLAPGVWRAEGGTHHSLVVEQSDHLVVVEAPQSTARSRAVLDTLRSRFANKPVRQAVMTHHHWDHSGGIREYLAAGIAVVAHERNIPFVRQIAAARKTVAPDELSRRPRTPVVTAVRDSLVVGGGDGRVVLYRMSTSHAEGLLAAYLPAQRILFTSDVLSPAPMLAQLGSAEVVAFARLWGIPVDRFVGGHGGVAAWADIERAAGR